MIIVFGTLEIDVYIPAQKLPELGQHVRCEDYDSFPGGKGANQAFAAGRAGSKTAIVGRIGDDSYGRRSTQNLKRESILGSGIGIVDRPTGCSFMLPGVGEDKTIISCQGANMETTSEQVPNEILGPDNTVIAQLLIPVEQTTDLFKRAKERGTRTVLNASPPQYATRDLLDLTDLLFLNASEICKLMDHLKMNSNGDVLELTQTLSREFKLDCVTTCGSKGAYACYQGQCWHVNAYPIDTVVDPTGAGDCFLGYLVSLLDQKYRFDEALHYAAIAGSLACQKQGAQSAVPFLDDVMERARDFPPPEKK